MTPQPPPMIAASDSPVLADACHTACPVLPAIEQGGEGAVITWMHEIIHRAGQCARLHDTCRTSAGAAP